MHQNSIIIICGATAVGKTAVAVELANSLQTEIISADSRQCFKELDIGVAKPTASELESIKHHFINSHSIVEDVNAGVFEEYAVNAADNIFKKQSVAIMVGGTGLYIKAFCNGLDDVPVTNPAIRSEIVKAFEENGLKYLQEQVAKTDPVFWKTAERENPQRLMRALEVIRSSGKSITTFHKQNKAERPFNIIKIGLELPREQLNKQINARVDAMVEQGLVHEAQSLLPKRNLNALQTVGYRELFDFFEEKISLSDAIAKIKTNTRQYAKRQMTWFKKDNEIFWLSPTNENLIQTILSKIPAS